MNQKLSCVLGIATIVLTACSGLFTPTSTPTPSPDEWLDRAAQAALAMKSAQFTLTREGSPAMLDPDTNTTFTEVSGQYQAPDRVSATVKVSLLGNIVSIQMLWLPEGNFISNPLTGQFQPAPENASFNGVTLFSADGLPSVLKDGIVNAMDVGLEKLEDVETRHLKGEADGAKLTALTAGTFQAGTAYPLEVWMETVTNNLVRFHIAEPDGNGWLVEIFAINEPVEIKAP